MASPALIFIFWFLPGLATAGISVPVIDGGEYPPGSTAVIRFYSSSQLQNLKARGFSQAARFWRTPPDPRAAWALLAVPLTAKPGRHWVKVSWEEDGTEFLKKLPLVVRRQATLKSKVRLSQAKTRLFKNLRKESRVIRAMVKDSGGLGPAWQGLFEPPLVGRISSPFGHSRGYNNEATGMHRGVDLAAEYGTEIHAPNHGTVRMARKLKAYGGAVILDHGCGLFTCYFHMARLRVRTGDRLRKGEILGWVGSEGIANGPHLHWQMMLNGQAVDPFQWLPSFQVRRLWAQKKPASVSDAGDSGLEGLGGN